MRQNGLRLVTGVLLLLMATVVALGAFEVIQPTLASLTTAVIALLIAWFHFRSDVSSVQGVAYVSIGLLFGTEILVDSGLTVLKPVRLILFATTIGIGLYLIVKPLSSGSE